MPSIVRPRTPASAARTTLDDIAKACGVSKQAVSHVLGTRAHLFRPETVALIRRTAAELGWKRNRAAQVMVHGRQGQIALLLSTTHRNSTVSPYFLAGLHDAAAARDQLLVVARIDDARLDDAEFVPAILAHLACDGLVVKYDTATPTRLIELIDAHGVPAIWANAPLDHDAVHPDEAGGVALGLDILRRSRRIAFADLFKSTATATEHYNRSARRTAFAALRPKRPILIATSAEDAPAQARAFLAEHRPDAVLCANDVTAQILIHAGQQAGLRIGHELEILAFAHPGNHSDGLPLAMLNHPDEAMGTTAVEMLAERIAQPEIHLATRRLPFTFCPGFGIAGMSA